jgi:hypothetical protein
VAWGDGPAWLYPDLLPVLTLVVILFLAPPLVGPPPDVLVEDAPQLCPQLLHLPAGPLDDRALQQRTSTCHLLCQQKAGDGMLEQGSSSMVGEPSSLGQGSPWESSSWAVFMGCGGAFLLLLGALIVVVAMVVVVVC